jgi:hypothetical protein
MVVMSVIVGAVVVRRRGMGVAAMRVVTVLDGIAGRVARMRTKDRDEARENGAQQRQKDDCLNHA